VTAFIQLEPLLALRGIVELPLLFSERAHRRPGFVRSMKDLIYPRREEQIFRCLIDRPGNDKPRLDNTSRQKYLPSLIEEE
jgi:hypothetical protein